MTSIHPWYNPTGIHSIGPPICPHCGKDASGTPGFPNSMAHTCTGLIAETNRRKTAEAVDCLVRAGYTVTPPDADPGPSI